MEGQDRGHATDSTWTYAIQCRCYIPCEPFLTHGIKALRVLLNGMRQGICLFWCGVKFYNKCSIHTESISYMNDVCQYAGGFSTCGSLRLLVTLSEIDHSILWTSDYTVRGVHHHMGGFAGPFEALAYALQESKSNRA